MQLCSSTYGTSAQMGIMVSPPDLSGPAYDKSRLGIIAFLFTPPDARLMRRPITYKQLFTWNPWGSDVGGITDASRVGTNIACVTICDVGGREGLVSRIFKICNLAECSENLKAFVTNQCTASVNHVIWSPEGSYLVMFKGTYFPRLILVYILIGVPYMHEKK
ncbi:PREDICTED: topless-related [Prunus dulcis]|uniref:PREDICTED: topless-related n=1 Tax=Prunus dulcis TaxID=3755 RepID=A0A5E4GHD1_PRUDU|nr:PREDICTED: topless-related [Prunus dulcis]